MSMSDPIADLLTRIRNAQSAGHTTVKIPKSRVKLEIVKLLKREGFVEGWVENEKKPQSEIKVFLKYDAAMSGTIRGVHRVSKPSRRVYVGKEDIPRVRNGLGMAILTTSKGLLTDSQARIAGVGGEVICHVW